MNTPKYTPRPWSAPSAGIYAGQITNGCATGPMIATTGTAEIMRSMRRHGLDPRQTVGNARLIAAAPDLLAIAQEIVAWERDPDHYGGDLADLAHRALSIITKATGQEALP